MVFLQAVRVYSGGGLQVSRFVEAPSPDMAQARTLETAADGGLWNIYLDRPVGPVDDPEGVTVLRLGDGTFASAAYSTVGWNHRTVFSPWCSAPTFRDALQIVSKRRPRSRCPRSSEPSVGLILYDGVHRSGALMYPCDPRCLGEPGRWWQGAKVPGFCRTRT